MKHTRLRLLVASAFTLLVAACSQVPAPQAQTDTQLTPQFGTKKRENPSNVVVSTDLNAVFILGNTFGSLHDTNAGSSDGYLRRYNRNGSLAWGVQFGSADEDSVVGLALDTHNRIYVAGDSRDHVTGVPHGFLKQYAVDGKLAWNRNIETPGDYNYVDGVATDANDNVFVIGSGTTGGDNNDFSFIKKYSRSGKVVWSKIYKHQSFSAIRVDRKGNLYVSSIYGPLTIRKFSNSGQLVWNKTLNKTSNVDLGGFQIVGDALYGVGEKYYETDSDDPSTEPETDVYVAKFDLAGNMKWGKSFGSKSRDFPGGVTADSGGNVYITGGTSGEVAGTNAGEGGVIVAKYNSSGRKLWVQQFGSADFDFGTSVAAFSLNEVYVGGYSDSNLGAGYRGNVDVFLARFDGSGKRVWTR